MPKYKNNLKVINSIIISILLVNLICICSCSNTNYPATNNYSQYTNYNLSSSLEEYINRIAKRLLIVNSSPELNQLNLAFRLSNNDRPILTVNYMPKINYKKNHSIVISKGLLNYLQDEAELAAIISIALETLTSNNIASNNYSVATTADHRIINQLYHAGYDPMAFIDLQQEYLNNQKNNNWLKFLFDPININYRRMNADKLYVTKNIPRGLQRGKQRYLSNIYLIKNID